MMMMMIRRVCLWWMVICLLLLLLVTPIRAEVETVDSSTQAQNDEDCPVFSAVDAASSLSTSSSSSSDCALWYYQGYVVTGRDLPRNASVVGWHDVIVPWRQHDRRAFPMFQRFYHFLVQQQQQQQQDDADDDDDASFRYVFAPTLNYPWNCHDRLYNLQRNMTELLWEQQQQQQPPLLRTRRLSTPWTTTMSLKAGDVLFTKCRHEDLAVNVELEDFPTTFASVQRHGHCLDGIQVRPSSIHGYGAFATRDFVPHQVITSGPMLHLHRSELLQKQQQQEQQSDTKNTNNRPGGHDDKKNENNGSNSNSSNINSYEELLRYCYGHPQTDLLLLPLVPAVNAMNHHDHQKANVAIRRVQTKNTMKYWKKPSEIAFGENEMPKIRVEYVALRHIQAGEELLLDYRPDSNTDDPLSWNEQPQEIYVPHDFFPSKWLQREVRNKPFVQLATNPLVPGQIDYVRLLQDGGNQQTPLAPYLHRVGLPPDLSTKLRKWADDMGITTVMQDYILGDQTLDQDENTKVRINGGTWWITRFESSWASNMHYITPDDDESHEQFMVALGEAGFDQVLQTIGQHFGLRKLTCFYPSFIAVSQASGSHMHSDSDDEKIWNVIFPVMQAENNTEAEINLGATEDFDSPLSTIPFRYDPHHALVLGKDGYHGTAPTDYRNGQMRMVASIYMGDFDDSNVDEYVDDWGDPPYPMDKLRDALMYRIHWSATDPSKTCGALQVNDFSHFH